MSHFQGFDHQNNGAGTAGILAGIMTGVGTFLGSEWAWWKAGFGPWPWVNPDGKSATIHAYFLYLIHSVFPNHVSDLNDGQTWGEFHYWLISHHLNDSFFASFWIPLTLGILAGLLTAWFVFRSVNRPRAGYIRGSRIN